MSVSDLKAGDNFLLFYQSIDTTSAACRTATTKRDRPTTKDKTSPRKKQAKRK
jgi:hypothetical protein